MPLTIDQRLDAARVRRIVLPMRSDMPALQHVNAWRVAGTAVFDTGKDDAETRAVWDDQPDLGRITDVFCTHGHPDHMGLVHHFETAFAARVHLAPEEMASVVDAARQEQDQATRWRQTFLRDMGALQIGASVPIPFSGGSTIPPFAYRPLAEDQVLSLDGSTWRVALGRGHSQRPALFLEDRLGILITGDQILPEMTPYVGVAFDTPDADPLGEMMAFLLSWADLDHTIVALPGHGAPFTDVGRRVRAHLNSYQRRLARTICAVAAPVTCADLLPSLFHVSAGQPVLDFHYTMAAALLNHLVATGAAQRWRGTDGAFRYQAG